MIGELALDVIEPCETIRDYLIVRVRDSLLINSYIMTYHPSSHPDLVVPKGKVPCCWLEYRERRYRNRSPPPSV